MLFFSLWYIVIIAINNLIWMDSSFDTIGDVIFYPSFHTKWRNVKEAWWVFQEIWTICILQVYQETWNKVPSSRLEG
jgi:hypothetical protein